MWTFFRIFFTFLNTEMTEQPLGDNPRPGQIGNNNFKIGGYVMIMKRIFCILLAATIALFFCGAPAAFAK